jgi:hypothetical protein
MVIRMAGFGLWLWFHTVINRACAHMHAAWLFPPGLLPFLMYAVFWGGPVMWAVLACALRRAATKAERCVALQVDSFVSMWI